MSLDKELTVEDLFTPEEYAAMDKAIEGYYKTWARLPNQLNIYTHNPLNAIFFGVYYKGCIVYRHRHIGFVDSKYGYVYASTGDNLDRIGVRMEYPINPTTECSHTWKTYMGLQEMFEYCTTCDKRR